MAQIPIPPREEVLRRIVEILSELVDFVFAEIAKTNAGVPEGPMGPPPGGGSNIVS